MEKNSKRKPGPYSYEERLKIVKLFLEEGYSATQLGQQFHLSDSSVTGWVKRYRAHGEAGLRDKIRAKSSPKPSTADPIKTQILTHKQANPDHGAKRISQIFRRFLGLQVSTHQVRETLREESLLGVPPKPKPKNDPKPRFFERSTPNQLWQTDIMTFRLAGQNAYLIGFMDDYSRYLVGLGAYRAQKAENVLETFKIALGEYGTPRELLSDNGRQYHNWRGTTMFEKTLQTHSIKHFRSQPHHPQTLGKIERFWQTVQQEFLFKCQFDSFENFRERLNLWVKYYNFKRPSQGIGGMCPADRFFEIQHDLKKTLEKAVVENVQELALRGQVKNPFYMVGRLGDQNVAILAEKGKLTLHLDDPDRPEGKQISCDLNAELTSNSPKVIFNAGENTDAEINEKIASSPMFGSTRNHPENHPATERTPGDCTSREMQSGVGFVVSDAECTRDLPGIIDPAGAIGPLGISGAGGDAERSGESPQAGQDTGGSAAEPPGSIAGTAHSETGDAGTPTGTSSGEAGNDLKYTVKDIKFNITI